MDSALAEFNLDRFSVMDITMDHPGTAGMIDVADYRTQVVSDSMKSIIESLTSAVETFGSAPAIPTARDAPIGIGANGTHASASALYSLTAQCLASTLAEYQRGKALFDATVADVTIFPDGGHRNPERVRISYRNPDPAVHGVITVNFIVGIGPEVGPAPRDGYWRDAA